MNKALLNFSAGLLFLNFNLKKVTDFLLEKRKGAKKIKIVVFFRTQENQRFSAKLLLNDQLYSILLLAVLNFIGDKILAP
ncbi:hypothetical protein EU348_12620 [Chryseobacterium indologenes]|uniref:Uncharacterized protein n=1 Tax=Chryseobacterium indologenes TaxID=253 RepID=A0A411DNN8_CHRID|nr:hypothetical protein EU348_12620 [Chryseobacterium indologenes]